MARKTLLVILIAIAVVSVAAQYIIQGPGWDLIAHFENGKSLLNPGLYGCLGSPPCGLDNGQLTFWYGTYFEPYRAPVSGVIFALVYLVSGNVTMIAYIGLLLALYIITIWLVARSFKIDRLLLYALLLSPAILLTSIIGGSEEMVSLILLFVALYFLSKRNPIFGLFLGLATLGKYPTLALIPMLLLLARPKKILYGALLFVVAVSPWLIFGQVFLHGALASYKMSYGIELDNRQAFWYSPWAYASILEYPIVFLAVAVVALRKKGNAVMASIKRAFAGRNLVKKIYSDDRIYLYLVLATLFVLSLAATLYIGPYWDTFTQARYGYLLSASAALLVAMALNDARTYTRLNLPLIAAFISIILLVTALAVYINGETAGYQLNANSRVFGNAANVLGSLDYGNCRIVTNDWVYMLWRNVSAFSPFYYNQTTELYPILAFYNKTAASNASSIQGLAEATPVYASGNFSVLLPQNHICQG